MDTKTPKSWYLGFTLMLSGAFLLIWLFTNLWPHPLEPQIWQTSDLATIDSSANGWDALQQSFAKSQLNSKTLTHDSADEVLTAVNNLEMSHDEFWEIATTKFSQLKVATDNKLHSYLNSLTEAIHFQDNITLKQPYGSEIFLLVDLGKAWRAMILRQALADQWDISYATWTRLAALNQSWLLSSRSALSHQAAIQAVKSDLQLLRRLLTKTTPQQAHSVRQQLKQFNPEQITYTQALIFEYLYQAQAIDLVLQSQDELKRISSWPQAFFNPSLIRKRLNADFSRLKNYAAVPDRIPENTQLEYENEIADLSAPLWWFYNPGGKILHRLLKTDLLSTMKTFFLIKQDIAHLHKNLLETLSSS